MHFIVSNNFNLFISKYPFQSIYVKMSVSTYLCQSIISVSIYICQYIRFNLFQNIRFNSFKSKYPSQSVCQIIRFKSIHVHRNYISHLSNISLRKFKPMFQYQSTAIQQTIYTCGKYLSYLTFFNCIYFVMMQTYLLCFFVF